MNIINKIKGISSNTYNNKDNNDYISNMKLLLEYILYERNYYNILHKNKLRNFGSYIYLSNVSDYDKSEQLMYILNMYCKSHYIFYVKILKNNIIIKFRVNNIEYIIEQIVDNVCLKYYYS